MLTLAKLRELTANLPSDTEIRSGGCEADVLVQFEDGTIGIDCDWFSSGCDDGFEGTYLWSLNTEPVEVAYRIPGESEIRRVTVSADQVRRFGELIEQTCARIIG